MCDQEAGPVPQASPLLSRRAPWDVRQKAVQELWEVSIWHVAHSAPVALHGTLWNPQHDRILMDS